MIHTESTETLTQRPCGFVNACHPATTEASPSALAFTKQQFYQLDGLSFDDGLRLGADVNAVSRSTPDFRAAISAFLKR